MNVQTKVCRGCKEETPKILMSNGYCTDCIAARAAKEQEKAKKVVQKQRQEAKKAASPDQKTLSTQELARRELARRRFMPFVLRFVPGYMPGWVHKDIAKRLEQFYQDVKDKKSPRLMLTVPPRHGKSQLTSKTYAAWLLGKEPSWEVITCSYSQDLANDFSRANREIIRSPEYAKLFPETKIKSDARSVEKWGLTEGGGFAAAGAGGPITGRGAHCLIIDDPFKNRDDAESATIRESIYNWYSSTAYTRLAPGGGIIIINTRWHEDDLSGRLISKMREDELADQWNLVNYPAIAEQDEEYRKKGEALHPERYNIDQLRQIQRNLIPRDWAALYQQRPAAEEGDYFKDKDFRYVVTPPTRGLLTCYMAWDLAIGTKEDNDYSVGVVAGVDYMGDIYVLDVVRDRWSSFELVEQILDLYSKWLPEYVGIEKGQIEMALGPLLKKRAQERKLHSFHAEGLKPGRRDKMARARPIQGRMQQGKVFFPKHADWLPSFVEEMKLFPNGKHDDQVDGIAWVGQLIDVLIAPAKKKPKAEKSWRDKLVNIDGTKYRSAMSA